MRKTFSIALVAVMLLVAVKQVGAAPHIGFGGNRGPFTPAQRTAFLAARAARIAAGGFQFNRNQFNGFNRGFNGYHNQFNGFNRGFNGYGNQFNGYGSQFAFGGGGLNQIQGGCGTSQFQGQLAVPPPCLQQFEVQQDPCAMQVNFSRLVAGGCGSGLQQNFGFGGVNYLGGGHHGHRIVPHFGGIR
jgi:hypothetical protein